MALKWTKIFFKENKPVKALHFYLDLKFLIYVLKLLIFFRVICDNKDKNPLRLPSNDVRQQIAVIINQNAGEDENLEVSCDILQYNFRG